MNDKLSWASAVAQSVLGTPVAVNPATNYLQLSEFDIVLNQMWDTVPILSGNFTTESKVKGNLNATMKGKVPFISGGVDTPPPCDPVLRMGGFTATVDSTPVGGSKYIYTRSGNQTDFSMCKYHADGPNGRTININSAMANSIKITQESGKTSMLEFSGVALAGGYNNALPQVLGALTRPLQTKIEKYAVNDVVSIVLDTDYALNKCDIELTNKITHKPVMSGYGFAAPELTDMESKFSFTTLINSALATLPFTRVLANQTPGTFSITFGLIAGRRINITSTKAQMEDSKESKTGELISNDVSGEFIDNDLVITFNSDLV